MDSLLVQAREVFIIRVAQLVVWFVFDGQVAALVFPAKPGLVY
jgi:hypothetical protein